MVQEISRPDRLRRRRTHQNLFAARTNCDRRRIELSHGSSASRFGAPARLGAESGALPNFNQFWMEEGSDRRAKDRKPAGPGRRAVSGMCPDGGRPAGHRQPPAFPKIRCGQGAGADPRAIRGVAGKIMARFDFPLSAGHGQERYLPNMPLRMELKFGFGFWFYKDVAPTAPAFSKTPLRPESGCRVAAASRCQRYNGSEGLAGASRYGWCLRYNSSSF